MKTKHIITKAAAVASALMLMATPLVSMANAGSSGGNTLTGTVQTDGGSQGQLVINSITPVKTNGIANNQYPDGFKYIIDVTIPGNETNLMMKFDNWMQTGGNHIIPAGGNIRFYSSQSSNANSQNNAITISNANTYSSTMNLTGDLGGSPAGTRRIQITVETKIPIGTTPGTYTDNFWINTQ